MEAVSSAAFAALIGVAAWLEWRRLLAYLRYFQQEGYEALRFLRWTNIRFLLDPAVWVAAAAAFLLTDYPLSAAALFILGLSGLALLQPDPRRSGKIQLKMTWRATRVISAAIALAFVLWVALMQTIVEDLQGVFAAAATLFASSPFLLIAANLLLEPYERYTQASYEAEAVQRVKDVHPFIIGITGSYGKSSSKAMLAHILQYKAPTLAASGSVNTLMGVTRHIREELVTGHQYMVVEMGAFKKGSIARLCRLTPPSAGLITAVGDMHLERFGSTDEIVRAKSELAQALPPGGLLVVNADSPGALRIAHEVAGRRVLLYGEKSSEALATRLEDVGFTRQGTSFTLRTADGIYSCFTPLLGRPIVLNLAGAFTLAREIGVDPDLIVAAMRTLKPVSNRLEVVEERGITWIRDAYNSNQFGFRAALEVAAALPVSRRFLATPGVIELGADQFQVNRTLSREAAEICDSTIVVSNTNKEAFVAGHRDAGREDALVPVANRGEAFQWLREKVRDGDAVILENDLPDLYERSAGVFVKRSERKAS
jgi:UDP-N-acetylmuramoyl-tripeptide--D-alanyl-D-alanine ligase